MSMDDAEAIRACYREYWRCMIAKDGKELRRLMADSYVLVHMTGVRQTREEFLDGLEKGVFQYYSAEHDSIQVTVSRDTAVMTGRSRVSAAVYGGRKNVWRLQGDFTLRKERGVWRFTGSEASTY
jgi:ketosteroid isomerase-like protein